jgi:hypothetical protein
MVDMITYKQMHSDMDSKDPDFSRGLEGDDHPLDDSFFMCLPATIPGFNMQKKEWSEYRNPCQRTRATTADFIFSEPRSRPDGGCGMEYGSFSVLSDGSQDQRTLAGCCHKPDSSRKKHRPYPWEGKWLIHTAPRVISLFWALQMVRRLTESQRSRNRQDTHRREVSIGLQLPPT